MFPPKLLFSYIYEIIIHKSNVFKYFSFLDKFCIPLYYILLFPLLYNILPNISTFVSVNKRNYLKC
jgi:hypothetical protein